MPTIKAKDVAFGRLAAPDLDQMEEFLTDFGMVRSARTPTALYMRGTGVDGFLHVTHLGEPRFIGVAFVAAHEDDLKTLSKLPGATGIEHMDEPGGGQRVRLTEPNGYQVEVIHGRQTLAPIAVARQEINSTKVPLNRKGELMRIPAGPSRPHRIGHVVMGSPKMQETVQWFRTTLGMVGSDDVYAGDKSNLIGSFNRLDRGDDYVDHHAFFCIQSPTAGVNHFSYEVQDIDDVFMGHAHLAKKSKYEHMWGIGRHLLGSQVYDYWADPWGRVHEHWADSDRLNVQSPTNLLSAEEALVSQWGDPPPEKFISRICP
jgi:catechol 2,3-dioxygenase-like lactoylglutathione lyase family enzyme